MIHILLVEDDDRDAELFEQALLRAHELDHRLTRVKTAAHAAERVRAGGVDVILLDLRLPDAVELMALSTLRAASATVPIVVLTGHDDSDLAVRALRGSAQDYLLKHATTGAAAARAIRYAIARARREAESADQARGLEANLHHVVASSADGMVIVDEDRIVQFANPSAAAMLGKAPGELTGAPFAIPFDDEGTHTVDLPGGRTLEMRVTRTEWERQPARLAALRDITEHRRAAKSLKELTEQLERANLRLARLATIDPLTDLLNRRGLDSVLQSELNRKERRGTPLVAVLFDCDEFKQVNDTQGLDVGDRVIREIGRNLKASIRPTDHVARIGGDEFLVLLPDTRPAEAMIIADRLRRGISNAPIPVPSGQVRITVSAGLGALQTGMRSLDEILALTHAALRRSKHAGKNTVFAADTADIDSDALLEPIQRTDDLLLQHGIEIRAVPHKLVSLPSEQLHGYELLGRGPKGPLEMPRDFFRAGLSTGMQTQIDLQCLDAAIQTALRLPRGLKFHVNLFPSTILETSTDKLLRHLLEIGDHGPLVIEISDQRIVGDPFALRDRLAPLRREGISIGVDDVGLGQSALEALLVLEPEVVKIDPQYIEGVSREQNKARLVRRMINVIEALGAEVIPEGVSSRPDLEALIALGARYAQGFLWGRPSLDAAPL